MGKLLQRPGLRGYVAGLLLAALALAPLAIGADSTYSLTVLTRIMIMGLAASGLNVALGYGGMVSFGHALYLGVGAYAVGMLSEHGVTNLFLHLAAALAVGAAVALIVGTVCLRTSGVAFIMITLAFAQMAYYFVISLKRYGGEDGLQIASRSTAGSLDLGNPFVFYYLVLIVLAACLWLIARGVHSRFGMVVRGCKSNGRRMRALGYATFRYRLLAYVGSALICVVAGLLIANLNRYTSPAAMQWTASGELIVMVVLGGVGTVMGPLVGAAVLLLVEDVLSSLRVGLPDGLETFVRDHWLAALGVLALVVVLSLRKGLFGSLPEPRSTA